MATISEEALQDKLMEGLSASFVEAKDESDGCGARFTILIVSSEFEGLPLLRRHRMVNKVIKEELESIHAITLVTKTPEEYEEMKK